MSGKGSGNFRPGRAKNDDVDKLLANPANVVPVVGAGISVGCGLPSGGDVITRLHRDFEPTQGSDRDPRVVATKLLRAGHRESHLQDSVARLCDEKLPAMVPTGALRAIAAISSRWVVTLNYDDSVEEAVRLRGLHPVSYTLDRPPPMGDLACVPAEEFWIFHIHGHCKSPGSIVLDWTKYAQVPNPVLFAYLGALMDPYTFCFVGTTLDEPHLVPFLNAMHFNRLQHVFMGPSSEVTALQNPNSRLLVDAAGYMAFEEYPDGDYPALDAFCEYYFLARPAARAALSASDFSVPAPVSGFVAPSLVRTALSEASKREVLAWSVELGEAKLVSPGELALNARTLVVGRPGAGKTELLRRAANEVPTGDLAVLIRLAQVSETLGDPVGLLAKWSRSAQPEERARDVDAEDFAQTRFHFLLDGLDEVPSGRQADLAECIIGMAEQLPQHRFTVTSRLVPSGELFDGAGWGRVELVPTSTWRKRFLEQNGLTYEQLIAETPGLAALHELLNLPFFLSAVLKLRAAGRLPEDGDAMAFAQALVDESLAAGEHDSVRDVLRGWLQSVALVMQMSGRADLSQDEVRRIALPSSANLGSHSAALDLFMRRAVLEVEGSRVRFVHRLMADALTAERLIELGPDTPGLLNVVAPRTPEAVGLRADWLTVMTLVGSRDIPWREAIRDRDELAWARMVPATASVDERRLAAQMLWRAYAKLQIWMSDQTSPGLSNDAEVLGKLLRDDDLDDVVNEVVASPASDSPQVRANAMEVLAEAGRSAELKPLVLAALDTDPEPVVRRHAAAAAVDIEFRDAYPRIRECALTTADRFEVQDLVSCAVKLARDDELLALALDLTAAGRGHHWAVEHSVRERLGPAAALKVLRAQVEHGDLSHLGGLMLKTVMEELPEHESATEDIGFIAVLGGDPTVLGECLRRQPEAALRGIVAGLRAIRTNFLRAAHLIFMLPDEVLDNATEIDEDLHARLLDLRTRWRAAPEPNEAAVDDEEVDEDGDETDTGVTPSVATFTALLQRDDQDANNLLQWNARTYAGLVGGLDEASRAELDRRFWEWWPEGGICANIEYTPPNQYNVSWPSHACLAYGGQLQPDVTPEQWVDVAQAPLFVEGQEEWLRARYVKAAAYVAARTIASSDARVWARLVDAIPDPLPPALVKAIGERVTQGDEFNEQLLRRLSDEGHKATLRKLSKAQGQLGVQATYHLAELGDVRAQRSCLSALLADFGTSKQIDSHTLKWMEGVSDRRLLPDLMCTLIASHHHRNPGAESFNDSMEAITNAIRRVGGVEVIQAYDDLMAQDPPAFDGVQFEVRHRDAVIHDILRAAGDEGRTAVMSALGLPLVEDSAD